MLTAEEFEQNFYTAYKKIMDANKLTLEDSIKLYIDLRTNNSPQEFRLIERCLCKLDLFYLMTNVLNQKGKEMLFHNWLYSRIRDVQNEPDFCLDLWGRGHFKTTILTIGQTIRDILNNPEISVCLVSFNTTTARDLFMKPIKTEFEQNVKLKYLFPEIFPEHIYDNSWNKDEITVARTSIGKEPTVVGFGLDNIQPGRHYDLLVLDDIICENTVATSDLIAKTAANYSAIQPLGHVGSKWRIIGTTYHSQDIYNTIITKGNFKLRKHPARVGGQPDGELVFMSEEGYKIFTKEMTNKSIACQMLLDPAGMGQRTFDEKWLKFYTFRDEINSMGWNIYILCDPATSQSKRADYTVMVVAAIGMDGCYYICDIIRDKLSLTDKAATIFNLCERWKPISVGWETTGQNSDIQYIEEMMDSKKFHFNIKPLKTPSTKTKVQRIEVLEPLFKEGKVFLPPIGSIIHKDFQNNEYDPIKLFINDEYSDFPLSEHDDILDALCRIKDPVMAVINPNRREVGYGLPTRSKQFSILGNMPKVKTNSSRIFGRR